MSWCKLKDELTGLERQGETSRRGPPVERRIGQWEGDSRGQLRGWGPDWDPPLRAASGKTRVRHSDRSLGQR
jgi:hypothetical protein